MLRAGNKDIGKLKKANVGILMGGVSSEREISLKSGAAVAACLREAGFNIKEIDIATDRPADIKRLLRESGIGLAFIALHGRLGEDGKIQKILGDLGIVYTGSSPRASDLALDKVSSRVLFEKGGLHTPRYSILNKKRSLDDLPDISFPVVVKPPREGSSIGLSIVDSPGGLKQALSRAFEYDSRAIVEEYIRGREVTVGILADNALPVIEIFPKRRFFDYSAKYKKGFTEYIVPAKLKKSESSACKDAALKAHRLLGCDSFSRVDIILSQGGRPYVLEVNTIPGFTASSLLPKAAASIGLTFSDLCIELLRLAYEKEK
ncbi:MAG: D-alanine--D-alanine ligase [Candidatus Omnitrophica bacterium]|nr:D-alanine--D-alanine ligase [Candidatus Omnitrophota bacterium]